MYGLWHKKNRKITNICNSQLKFYTGDSGKILINSKISAVYMPPRKRRRVAKREGDGGVPYARGFRPPSEKRRLAALGKIAETEESRRAFAVGDGFFSPVPSPSSVDDWLAQYNETGQTYDQFVSQCPWLSRRKLKYTKTTFDTAGRNIREKYPGGKIYLQPLGNFDVGDAPNFDHLAEYARLFFCLPVEVLPVVTLEEDSEASVYWIESAEMRSRVDKTAERKSPRASKCRLDLRRERGHLQLNCSSLLSRLQRALPDDALCLIGLTMFDLYEEDADLFVAGLASGSRRVAVFSFFRYDPALSFSPEFWYDLKRSRREKAAASSRETTVLQRSCKLLVHELGHLLGLDHCVWFSCLMNGAGHLLEDFRQPMVLCPVDLRKLQTLTGCDVAERYAGLLAFFKRCGLREEADWVERRLKYILAE